MLWHQLCKSGKGAELSQWEAEAGSKTNCYPSCLFCTGMPSMKEPLIPAVCRTSAVKKVQARASPQWTNHHPVSPCRCVVSTVAVGLRPCDIDEGEPRSIQTHSFAHLRSEGSFPGYKVHNFTATDLAEPVYYIIYNHSELTVTILYFELSMNMSTTHRRPEAND